MFSFRVNEDTIKSPHLIFDPLNFSELTYLWGPKENLHVFMCYLELVDLQDCKNKFYQTTFRMQCFE